VAPGMQRGEPQLNAKRDYAMSSETTPRQVPPQRGEERRRNFGRRIVRDRRRDAIAVPVERRTGADRRSGQRRARADRRTRPSAGFRFLDR